METLQKDSETGCCPRFDPAPWEGKKIDWEGKLFIKDRVTSFLHIPLNFGKVMVRNMEKIQRADALTAAPIVLSDENSLWGSDVYIDVSKEVPDAETAKISGTFLTKVYEGPYRDIRKWIKDMQEYVKSSNEDLKKLYFYYTTCPKCAKYYGKNYVVLLAQI